MSLEVSTVHKHLDTEIKVFGLAAQDLLFILLCAMSLNYLLSGIPMAEIIIFGVPSILSIALYFGKKGKPKGYLFDLIRFYLTDGFYSGAEHHEFKKEYITNGSTSK